jgi:hypothetical protein
MVRSYDGLVDPANKMSDWPTFTLLGNKTLNLLPYTLV